MAIVLKLAELYAFADIKGFYPLFLLDEVLAELDQNHKALLLQELSQADYQSFLTSVETISVIPNQASNFLVKRNHCTKGEINMYIHLGNNYIISAPSIIAILNYEPPVSTDVRDIVEIARMEKNLVSISEKGKEKAVVICDQKFIFRLYPPLLFTSEHFIT